jgi:hypothetical protein
MNFAEDIAGVLKDRTCIVGVGNYIRRDDAVGLYLVDALKESVDSDAVQLLNAEDIIESYAFQIAGATRTMSSSWTPSGPAAIRARCCSGRWTSTMRC